MNSSESHQLIGESPAFLNALEQVSKLAALQKPVLIIGERGTGKELTAERLHYLSPNWDQVLIKLNCAALPETLLESELFGHEAGAFTGATRRHIGRFEQAHGGTLFLDEIANMSLRLQEKLLRVVEYGEFERVGGTQTLSVDIRLVGAANMDLPLLVEQGKFRADLLDRLSFDVITLPPLRHRREDIPVLARHFAMGMIKELKRDFFAGFSDSAMHQLMTYAWPGNLRELKNVIERAVYRNQEDEAIDQIDFDPFESPYRAQLLGSRVEEKDVPADETVQPRPTESEPEDTSLPADFKQYIQDHESTMLRKALAMHRYNQRQTAQALGLSYHQMRAYIRKYPFLLEDSATS